MEDNLKIFEVLSNHLSGLPQIWNLNFNVFLKPEFKLQKEEFIGNPKGNLKCVFALPGCSYL